MSSDRMKDMAQIGIILFLGFLFLIGKGAPIHPIPTSPVIRATLPTIVSSARSKNIFVPSWTIDTAVKQTDFDFYYYFGLTPTLEGEIAHDEGYVKLATLDVPASKTMIVLRMLDSTIIETFLTDKTKQALLITAVRKEIALHNRAGVVLDLELPFILRAERKEQLTSFVQQLCTGIHKDYRYCFVAVYGDVFYRKRPYDIKAIGTVADRILVMAYDLHKAGGEPGPNFDFENKDEYDFKRMVADYTSEVQTDKLEVVFGMYGYDWTMSNQGMPLKQATAESVYSLTNRARYASVTRNKSLEPRIDYTDEEGRKHIVWYEDEESAAVKIDYLRQQRIGHVSYWAYGYY